MRILTPILFVAILLSSCRKEPTNSYQQNSLELSKTILSDGKLKYEWSQVNTDDFIEYVFYVSDNPITDVDENGSVAATELFRSSKKLENIFIDSLGSTFDQKYIKVIARIENSTLSSKTLINEDVHIFSIASTFSFAIIPLPEEKKIIILNSSGIKTGATLINYETKELELENEEIESNYFGYKLGFYNNEKVIYNHNINQLDIYKAANLEHIKSMTLNIPLHINLQSTVYLKNNILCFRGSGSSAYYLYSYDLGANLLKDSFSNGVINVPPIVGQTNPTFLMFIDNNNSQLSTYTINQNGDPQFYKTISNNTLYLSNSVVTEGAKPYLVTPVAQVFDENLQLINDFANTTGSFNYFQGASPDMEYYVFRHSTSGQPEVNVYKNGIQDIYQKIFMRFNPTVVFPDYTDIIYLFRKNINGKIAYVLIKTPLKP